MRYDYIVIICDVLNFYEIINQHATPELERPIFVSFVYYILPKIFRKIRCLLMHINPTPIRTTVPDKITLSEYIQDEANAICEPAYNPTASKPPVAVIIKPEMGGPARAPIDMMLKNIPTRPPTSAVSPISIKGLQSREIYEPEPNL